LYILLIIKNFIVAEAKRIQDEKTKLESAKGLNLILNSLIENFYSSRDQTNPG
jgi:hypothetical protein